MTSENKEIEEINEILVSKLGSDLSSYKYFNAGEFVYSPNQSGYFKRDANWYSYEIDERCYCRFFGPFGKIGIICICGLLLHANDKFQDYQFTEEESRCFMKNHFHSLEEIDEYCKLSK